MSQTWDLALITSIVPGSGNGSNESSGVGAASGVQSWPMVLRAVEYAWYDITGSVNPYTQRDTSAEFTVNTGNTSASFVYGDASASFAYNAGTTTAEFSYNTGTTTADFEELTPLPA
jgi:hypothetical protein